MVGANVFSSYSSLDNAGSLVDLPDPVARSFESLRAQLNTLTKRVEELEYELGQATSAGKNDDANNQPLSSSGT